ncbi:hypothetical protein LguiB_019893 [Lonicera macranthoides]
MEDVRNLEKGSPESSEMPTLSSQNMDQSNSEVSINHSANGKVEIKEEQDERGQEEHRGSVATDSETRAMRQHTSDLLTENPKASDTQREENTTPLHESIPSYSLERKPEKESYTSDAKPNNALQFSQEDGFVINALFGLFLAVIITEKRLHSVEFPYSTCTIACFMYHI